MLQMSCREREEGKDTGGKRHNLFQEREKGKEEEEEEPQEKRKTSQEELDLNLVKNEK